MVAAGQFTNTSGLPVTLTSRTGPNVAENLAARGQARLPATLVNLCSANAIWLPVFDAAPVMLAAAYEQANRCLHIIVAALERVGATVEDVVRTRVYLVRAEDWEGVGRAHGEVFGEIRPASAVVVVAGLLDPRWLVEIEAEAIVSS